MKVPLQLAGEPFENIENAFVFKKSYDNEKLVKQVDQILNDMK